MATAEESAAKFHKRAEELRVIAQSMKSSENREALTKLAFDYEKMADRLLTIEARKPPLTA